MDRDAFIEAMEEFLRRFDYPEVEVRATRGVFALGTKGLDGIACAFRTAMSCSEDLPNSPFTVPGGQVLYRLEAKDKTLTLTLVAR